MWALARASATRALCQRQSARAISVAGAHQVRRTFWGRGSGSDWDDHFMARLRRNGEVIGKHIDQVSKEMEAQRKSMLERRDKAASRSEPDRESGRQVEQCEKGKDGKASDRPTADDSWFVASNMPDFSGLWPIRRDGAGEPGKASPPPPDVQIRHLVEDTVIPMLDAQTDHMTKLTKTLVEDKMRVGSPELNKCLTHALSQQLIQTRIEEVAQKTLEKNMSPLVDATGAAYHNLVKSVSYELAKGPSLDVLTNAVARQSSPQLWEETEAVIHQSIKTGRIATSDQVKKMIDESRVADKATLSNLVDDAFEAYSGHIKNLETKLEEQRADTLAQAQKDRTSLEKMITDFEQRMDLGSLERQISQLDAMCQDVLGAAAVVRNRGGPPIMSHELDNDPLRDVDHPLSEDFYGAKVHQIANGSRPVSENTSRPAASGKTPVAPIEPALDRKGPQRKPLPPINLSSLSPGYKVMFFDPAIEVVETWVAPGGQDDAPGPSDGIGYGCSRATQEEYGAMVERVKGEGYKEVCRLQDILILHKNMEPPQTQRPQDPEFAKTIPEEAMAAKEPDAPNEDFAELTRNASPRLVDDEGGARSGFRHGGGRYYDCYSRHPGCRKKAMTLALFIVGVCIVWRAHRALREEELKRRRPKPPPPPPPPAHPSDNTLLANSRHHEEMWDNLIKELDKLFANFELR